MMDLYRFDDLARSLATPGSRRRALALALAAALPVAGVVLASDADARNNKDKDKNKGKKKGKGPTSGTCKDRLELCTSSDECCPGAICGQNGCAIPDKPRCCVGIGSPCRSSYCDCCGGDDIACLDRGQGERCYYTK